MRIVGTHAIHEALLNYKSAGVLYIAEDHKNKKEFLSIAQRNATKIRIVYKSRRELVTMGVKQGALFVSSEEQARSHVNLHQWLSEHSRQERLIVLVLDHVQDAQNFGAIFRTAAVFNVGLLISTMRRSAPENEYAHKASSGGMVTMPSCKVANISEAIRVLKKHNVWTYGLATEGKSLVEFTFPPRCAFVLGNEHKGVSPLVKDKCDDVLSIPMFLPAYSAVDSLNVSVSAGIVCHEYRRHYA